MAWMGSNPVWEPDILHLGTTVEHPSRAIREFSWSPAHLHVAGGDLFQFAGERFIGDMPQQVDIIMASEHRADLSGISSEEIEGSCRQIRMFDDATHLDSSESCGRGDRDDAIAGGQ